jgi:hypothetical protein
MARYKTNSELAIDSDNISRSHKLISIERLRKRNAPNAIGINQAFLRLIAIAKARIVQEMIAKLN